MEYKWKAIGWGGNKRIDRITVNTYFGEIRYITDDHNVLIWKPIKDIKEIEVVRDEIIREQGLDIRDFEEYLWIDEIYETKIYKAYSSLLSLPPIYTYKETGIGFDTLEGAKIHAGEYLDRNDEHIRICKVCGRKKSERCPGKEVIWKDNRICVYYLEQGLV